MEPYRYWVFISYSHQDSAWGEWLHRRLETWRVPRRLVGGRHWSGTVPARLYPVFRDRAELPGSSELGTALQRALRESRCQIVICSPRAAASRWVNEEIRYFKSLGRAERVLALLVDGEPNASDTPERGLPECLPPALRLQVLADGAIGGARVEPLAADARPGRGGREDALLRLLAGVLGVGYDDLRQRERRRTRLRWLARAAGIAAIVAGAAALLSWQQAEKRVALEEQALAAQRVQALRAGIDEQSHGRAARAAVEFQRALALGADTPALRWRLARALDGVGAWRGEIAPGGSPYGLAFSDDGRLLAASLYDGADDSFALAVHDAATGAQRFRTRWCEDNDRWIASPRFSADGSLVLLSCGGSARGPRTLRVWDSASGGVLLDVPALSDRGPMETGEFSPDSRELLSADDGGGVHLHDVRGGTARSFATGRPLTVAVFGGADEILTGDRSGAVIRWSASRGRALRVYGSLGSPVMVVAGSRDGRWTAAGAADGSIRVWDAASGALVVTSGHRGRIRGLEFSGDGGMLLSSADDGFRVSDTRNGAIVFTSGEVAAAQDAALDPRGPRLLVSDGSQALLYHIDTHQLLRALDGHAGEMLGVAFSPDGARVATAGVDGRVVLWDTAGAPLAELRHASNIERWRDGRLWVYALVADPAQGRLLSFGDDGVRLWRVDDLAPAGFLPAANDRGARGALGAGYVAQGDKDGVLRLWQAAGLAPVRQWQAARGDDLAPQISRDGALVAAPWFGDYSPAPVYAIAGAADEPLAQPQLDEPRALQMLAGGGLAFGSGGRVQAWRSDGGMQWSVPAAPAAHTIATADTVPTADAHPTAEAPPGDGAVPTVPVLLANPDGTRLAGIWSDGTVRVIDAADGRVTGQSQAPRHEWIWSGAWHERAGIVAVGHADGNLALWHTRESRWQVLPAAPTRLEALAISPDAAAVAAATTDGRIALWDVRSGELLGFPGAHREMALSVAWLDDATLASTGKDGAVRLWRVGRETRTPAELARLLGCRVPWQLAEGSATLLPRAPAPAACAPAAATSAISAPAAAPPP